MNVIVCIKQIPDPEAAADKFSVDASALRMVIHQGVKKVINPFDENCLEAALQLKKAQGGRITAVTMGPAAAMSALKHALAMGVDEAVQVNWEGQGEAGPQVTALVLAQAIKRLGPFDLILCGRQAGDWDQGQVGPGIAAHLDIPCVTIVRRVEPQDRGLRVERLAEDGYEVWDVPLPAVLTLTSEINLPRLPTVANILRTGKMKIPVWSRNELGLEDSSLEEMTSLYSLRSLYIPTYEGKCQVMEGESVEEMTIKLFEALKAEKIL